MQSQFPLSLNKLAVKSSIKEVPKKWGTEFWVVNTDEYCGKFLFIENGGRGSLHYHAVKKETFYCIKGQVVLTIEGKDYMMNPFSRPKTVMPKMRHQFEGLTDAIILEISTHHDEEDTFRIEESQCSPIKRR